MCLSGQGLHAGPFPAHRAQTASWMGVCGTVRLGGCHMSPSVCGPDGFSGLAPMPVMLCACALATLVGARPQGLDWFHVIADFPPVLAVLPTNHG